MTHTLLVTGGAGFIGLNFVDHWSRHHPGDRIVVTGTLGDHGFAVLATRPPATVVEVLPNGHLVVVGEKQVGLNQNVDVLRFSGTIDPRDIQPGSIVSSTQVANARIQSRGRGAQDEALTVGWLSRFFFSAWPF